MDGIAGNGYECTDATASEVEPLQFMREGEDKPKVKIHLQVFNQTQPQVSVSHAATDSFSTRSEHPISTGDSGSSLVSKPQ